MFWVWVAPFQDPAKVNHHFRSCCASYQLFFPALHCEQDKFSDAKKCVPLVQMLMQYMGVQKPLLVVSITGARRDDTVALLDSIKAIMDAAVTEMKNVWFITTGLGDGVRCSLAPPLLFTVHIRTFIEVVIGFVR
jgi:hypothetical protein